MYYMCTSTSQHKIHKIFSTALSKHSDLLVTSLPLYLQIQHFVVFGKHTEVSKIAGIRTYTSDTGLAAIEWRHRKCVLRVLITGMQIAGAQQPFFQCGFPFGDRPLQHISCGESTPTNSSDLTR